MLNELFAREILETSIGLGILQEMNGGVVIYHEASKKTPKISPPGGISMTRITPHFRLPQTRKL